MKETFVRKINMPSEEIVQREHLIAVYNIDKMLRAGKFVVKLACGHLCYTRSLNKAVCPRCTEMLRRSITDGSEDYESFRKGLIADTMEWSEDPCRQFNENLQ